MAGVALLSSHVLAHQPVDRAELARLPAQAQGVIAISDVRAVQSTRAGQSLERFLVDIGSWDRTRQAWDVLGKSLGYDNGQVIEHLAAGRVVLAASALDAPRPMTALLAAVPLEVERRVRERLRPVPRTIDGSTPVLSLEGGTFEVATSVPAGAARADLLLAPDASRPLFDTMLPMLGEAAPRPQASPAPTLASTACWSRLTGLPPGRVEMLYQAPPPGQARLFALSSDFRGNSIDARYVVSSAMLDEPSDHPAWPQAAINLLSRDALLMVAGVVPEATQVDAAGAAESAHPTPDGQLLQRPDRTLLDTMMANLNLPPDMAAHVRGLCLFAAQADAEPERAPAPLSLAVALPVDDVRAFVASADAFVAKVSGAPDLAQAGGPLASADFEAVRVLSISAHELPLLDGAFGQGSGGRGAVAWGFVRGQGNGGWWVLRVRGGQGQEPVAVAGVQELAAALAATGQLPPSPSAGRQVFRLYARPAALVARSAAFHPDQGANALRWLTRVETSMSLDPAGDYRGSIHLEMNDALLDDSEVGSTAATSQRPPKATSARVPKP